MAYRYMVGIPRDILERLRILNKKTGVPISVLVRSMLIYGFEHTEWTTLKFDKALQAKKTERVIA